MADKENTDAAAAAPADAGAAAGGKKSGKVPAPNEKQHKADLDAIVKAIADLNLEMDKVRLPPRDKDAPVQPKPKTPVQLQRDELFGKLKELRAQKDPLIKQQKDFKEKIAAINTAISKKSESTQSSNKGGKTFKSVEEIDKAIADMEYRLRTEHFKLVDEKRAVSDINALKRQKANFAATFNTKAAIGDLKQQINGFRDKNSELYQQISKIRDQETAIKKEIDGLKDDVAEANKLKAEKRRELKAKLDEKWNEKRELVKNFRAAKQAYYEATKEEREKARQRREEENRLYKEAKEAEAAAKQKEIDDWEAAQPPYKEEMDTCNVLISYAKGLGGAAGPAEAKPVEAEKAAEIKDTEGNGQFLRRKKDDDDDATWGGMGGKGKKGKKNRKKGAGKDKKLKHSPSVFAQFSKVGIKPPTSSSGVAATLKELEDKLAWYKVAPPPPKKEKKTKKAAEPEPEAEEEEEFEDEVAEEEAAAPASSGSANYPKPDKVPNPPDHLKIYDDDTALGKGAPNIERLKYVKGEAVDLKAGKPTAVLFWAKFAKGDYVTVCAFSELKEKYPELQVLGVSCDPEEDAIHGFIKKLGTALPELYVDCLKAEYPLAFDPSKLVQNAFKKTAGLMSLGASAAFLINGEGTIVWREQFNQKHLVKDGQFGEQVRRLIMGEELIKNGPKPVEEDSEDESDCEMGGDSDSDGFVF